jgi:hypothetical protein
MYSHRIAHYFKGFLPFSSFDENSTLTQLGFGRIKATYYTAMMKSETLIEPSLIPLKKVTGERFFKLECSLRLL